MSTDEKCQEMLKDEKIIKETFDIKWRIENYDLVSPLIVDTIIESPKITLSHFLNTRWYLSFYVTKFGYLNYRLARENDGGPEDVKLDFVLYNNLDSERKKGVVFKENNCFSINLCTEYSNVVDLECHMSMYAGSAEVSGENEDDSPVYVIETRTKKLLTGTSMSANNCVIRTTFTECDRSFICSIEDFSFETVKTIELPSLNFNKECSLFISLHLAYKNDTNYLQIKFCFKEMLEKRIFCRCYIDVLDSGGEILASYEYPHCLYFNVQKHTLNIFDMISWNKLKKRNSKYLRFKLRLSDGSYLSDIILWPRDIKDEVILPSKRVAHNGFPAQVVRFYHERKFCNVILRTECTAFECHKVILCAMSPVFATMFESGMKESATNVVHVEDFDSDTVRKMLDFMYTGAVQELKLESAMSLYSAADKYDIGSLKNICREFLKQSSNEENVCDILSFSDARNDQVLKLSVIQYISEHKRKIIKSAYWKEFADKNLHLAYEVALELNFV